MLFEGCFAVFGALGLGVVVRAEQCWNRGIVRAGEGIGVGLVES